MQFGGNWTERKLDAVEAYLKAYVAALKNHRGPVKLRYIDAFAGDGYAVPDGAHELQNELFESYRCARNVVRGSARRAVALDFDAFMLIETSEQGYNRLQKLRDENPGKDIKILRRDANEVLQELCSLSWNNHRAVVFLDPYGVQVRWATMEALARTGGVDVWIWWPLGQAVNRMLPRNGRIGPSTADALAAVFGSYEWEDVFYERTTEPTLFDGGREKKRRSVAVEDLAAYYHGKLSRQFSWVSDPVVMKNARNKPIYMLCLAVASRHKNALEAARRISTHILNRIND